MPILKRYSARSQRLLEVLEKCVGDTTPCPSISDLRDMIRGRNARSVTDSFRELERVGIITIEVIPPNGRIISMTATGKSTAPSNGSIDSHRTAAGVSSNVAARCI